MKDTTISRKSLKIDDSTEVTVPTSRSNAGPPNGKARWKKATFHVMHAEGLVLCRGIVREFVGIPYARMDGGPIYYRGLTHLPTGRLVGQFTGKMARRLGDRIVDELPELATYHEVADKLERQRIATRIACLIALLDIEPSNRSGAEPKG